MRTYARTSAALLLVAIIGTAIAQERPAVPEPAAGYPGALSSTPPSGRDLIRETKFKVLRQHYEKTLDESFQLETNLALALPEDRPRMEAKVQAMKTFLAKLEADLSSLAEQSLKIPGSPPPCEVDLRNPGEMNDIVSNVLMRAENRPEPAVRVFLRDAPDRYVTGDDLLKAAAEHFKIDQKKLAGLVDQWRHINCGHAAIPGYVMPDAVSVAESEATASVAKPKPHPPAGPPCEVDLGKAVKMANIVSNVMMRAERKPEPEVHALCEDAKRRYATGDEVLKAAAEHFKIDQKKLAALVDQWRHINCKHAAIPGYVVPDAVREANEDAAEPKPQPPATPPCKVDLGKTQQMANILSNVLMRAENRPEPEVAAFREDAKKRYATGAEVLKAAAEHFKIDQKKLAGLVDQWRHINCKHAAIPGYVVPDAAREATTGSSPGAALAEDAPPYRSSVVGTDFDFITDSDPNTFVRLEGKGKGPAEMPDKSDRSAPLVQEAFLFVAHFNDGTRVQLAIDSDFKTEDVARQEALRYTPRLGKLPTALRRGVERVVIHQGGENVTAFSDVGLMVFYSDNATKRIGTHDLEETVFHESVHAAWDKRHANSTEWQDAQKKDGRSITDYARKNSQGEDLAESALFAYALLHFPDRIPKKEASKIAQIIPNRIAFVEKLLPKGKPLHFPVEAKR